MNSHFLFLISHLKAVPLHPLFGVTDGGKIGELPAMLRWNDTTI